MAFKRLFIRFCTVLRRVRRQAARASVWRSASRYLRLLIYVAPEATDVAESLPALRPVPSPEECPGSAAVSGVRVCRGERAAEPTIRRIMGHADKHFRHVRGMSAPECRYLERLMRLQRVKAHARGAPGAQRRFEWRTHRYCVERGRRRGRVTPSPAPR